MSYRLLRDSLKKFPPSVDFYQCPKFKDNKILSLEEPALIFIKALYGVYGRQQGVVKFLITYGELVMRKTIPGIDWKSRSHSIFCLPLAYLVETG